MTEVLIARTIEEARATALTGVEIMDDQIMRDYYRRCFMMGTIGLAELRREEFLLNQGGIFLLPSIDALDRLLRNVDFPTHFRVEAVNKRVIHARRAEKVGFFFKPGVRFARDYKECGGVLSVLSDLTIPDSFSDERARDAMNDLCGAVDIASRRNVSGNGLMGLVPQYT